MRKKKRKKEYNYQPSPIPLLPLLPMTKRPPTPQLQSLSLQIYHGRHSLRIPIVAIVIFCGLSSLLQVFHKLLLIITSATIIVSFSRCCKCRLPWPFLLLWWPPSSQQRSPITLILPLLQIIIAISILLNPKPLATNSHQSISSSLCMAYVCWRRAFFSYLPAKSLQRYFFLSFFWLPLHTN